MKLTLTQIQQHARELSGLPVNVLTEARGLCMLHPQGQSVTFDLHRSDLDLPIEEYGHRKLVPAIAALKSKLGDAK